MPSTSSPSSNRPVTLITGYRGLAEYFIRGFQGAGHQVCVLVKRAEKIAELRDVHPDVDFVGGQVENRSAITDWISGVAQRYGRIDCLINNAAVAGPGGRLHEIPFEDFESAMQVNLLSPIYLCHSILKYFAASKTAGVIINLSGGGATYARPYFAAYATAKCGLVRFTETIAQEYPEHLIYAISPGGLKTQMMSDIAACGRDRIGKEYDDAMKRLQEGGEDPTKAARLALWLFENRPKHLHGRVISAIWDDYASTSEISADWWTLRRVDEQCRKKLSS